MNLSAVGNSTNVSVDASSIAYLSCEMALYLRPVEDLNWLKNGVLITSADKYNISYSYGSGKGQFGGSESGASRLSTLAISDLHLIDSGIYTCSINNTGEAVDIQLDVVLGMSTNTVNIIMVYFMSLSEHFRKSWSYTLCSCTIHSYNCQRKRSGISRHPPWIPPYQNILNMSFQSIDTYI